MKPNEDSPKVVTDSVGARYELDKSLGRGGQGEVYAIRGKALVAKLYRAPSPQMRRRIDENIKYLRRLPLEGLKVARPVRVLAEPHCGYIMDLMADMVPLTTLTELPRDAASNSGAWYIRTGGLKRRLQCLASAATTLQEVHAAGLVYCDPSPSNFFVSSDSAHAVVQLIDVDNLTDGRVERRVFTPGYAAPELLRSSSANTLTDAYAFAIIAYRMLAQRHPFIGDDVEDGDPDLETEAFEGRLAWIDDPNGRNRSVRGIPRELVLTQELKELFAAMFIAGRHAPESRPGLAKFAAALRSACDACVVCTACDASYFGFHLSESGVAPATSCPWCNAPSPEFVLARVFIARQWNSTRTEGERPQMRICFAPHRSKPDGVCERDADSSCLQGCVLGAELTAGRRVIQAGTSVDFAARDLLHTTDTAPLLSFEFQGTRLGVSLKDGSKEWIAVTHKGRDYPLALNNRNLQADGLDEQVWIMPRQPTGLFRAITLKHYPVGGTK
jgi:DNA-binding helix-hairpin-helix protein with protein kinase domain